jgi:cytochrome c-type biogenesis protein CcmH
MMRYDYRHWLAGLLLLLGAVSAHAVVNGYKYPFDDPDDIARFQHLAEELRCPKCQNQNLADSNAPVAGDMRDKVYELMNNGQTDEQIIDYLVARYGDFVHYKPPVRAETYVLWFGPLLAFLLGLLILRQMRRNQKAAPAPLTAEERQQLEQLKAAVSADSSNDQKANNS